MNPARVRTPDGLGWERWTAGAMPNAELWVNEERREILIREEGAERRIASPDSTSFALEVADIERYYDAVPTVGTRDSSAILSSPLPILSTASSLATDAVPLPEERRSVLEWLRQRLTAEVAGFIFALGVVAVIVSAAVTGTQSEKDAWMAWAERRGSSALQAALGEGREDEQLFRDAIAAAITPPVSGVDGCPREVRYGSPVPDFDERMKSTLTRIRVAATANSAQFPEGALVVVEEPAGCYFPANAATGICVPVTLRQGHYSVKTCYRLEQ
jgi:hypothetical protein